MCYATESQLGKNAAPCRRDKAGKAIRKTNEFDHRADRRKGVSGQRSQKTMGRGRTQG